MPLLFLGRLVGFLPATLHAPLRLPGLGTLVSNCPFTTPAFSTLLPLQWMRNPISTKELSPAALGCGNPGGAPATPQQLAMLLQPPSPPSEADTAVPGARDSGSDGGNGGGGNKNTVKMPPMGVRISMTIGGERRRWEIGRRILSCRFRQ